MDYFELIKTADSARTAIIEDGNAYTYGELTEMALGMTESILQKQQGLSGENAKKVFIIKEKDILKQLVLFLACNACGIIPVIIPADEIRQPVIGSVPENTCMAVATSGTTGIPKILYRTYKSWSGFFPVQNKIFGINKESVLFAQGSLAFTGNLNLYLAQFYAGGIVVAENNFNPVRWAYVIEKENVNAIYLIPSKIMLLPDIIKKSNNNIKSVISGSQSLCLNDARKIKKIFPMADITLYYGASELNYITYVKDTDMTKDKNLIGKPFPGVKVFIQNGKIYVDNKYHAEGIKCPYSVSDNGYMDKEGNLYFKGRSDDIVLIHGRKVSLINIENKLEEIETIHEAAVIPVMGNRKYILLAFIDFKEDAIYNNTANENNILEKLPGNSDIFKKLRKKLANYEMPCKIIVLKQMVYNGSGKKDKKKILEMYKNWNLEKGGKMDFLDLAKERYSLRKMDKDHIVEKEKLEKIAEAARISPSACNLQRHRLKIVTSKEGIEKIRKCTECHFNAPAVIIVSLEKDTGNINMNETDSIKFGLMDIGIIVAHMSLQAAELGVGTTIVGMFDREKLIKEFDIPDSQEPILIMPVGYPADGGGPCILHKSRIPIDKTTEWV